MEKVLQFAEDLRVFCDLRVSHSIYSLISWNNHLLPFIRRQDPALLSPEISLTPSSVAFQSKMYIQGSFRTRRTCSYWLSITFIGMESQ